MRCSGRVACLAVAVAALSSVASSSPPQFGAKGECDAQDAECGETPVSPEPQVLALIEGEELNETEVNETRKNITKAELLESLGYWRAGILLALFGSVQVWIVCTIKFAIDGSLPARLAMWGFLPEAYAAISTRAVVHLLRLKKAPLPAIVLRSCITDAGAIELAEGIRNYPAGEVEVLEMPHNPKLGQEGVRALVAVAMEEASKLEELDFSYNPQLSSFIVPEVLPLLPSRASKITTLRLMDCGLNQAAVQQLVKGLRTSALRQLDLSLNSLAGAGQVLSEICEAPILEEIMLRCCGLSAEDVGLVAENLPYTSLKAVQLGGNRFGRPGLEALVEHLPACQVDELGLESNELELEDLSLLGLAWVKRPFSRVKLTGNRMSSEEIGTFVATLKTMSA